MLHIIITDPIHTPDQLYEGLYEYELIVYKFRFNILTYTVFLWR